MFSLYYVKSCLGAVNTYIVIYIQHMLEFLFFSVNFCITSVISFLFTYVFILYPTYFIVARTLLLCHLFRIAFFFHFSLHNRMMSTRYFFFFCWFIYSLFLLYQLYLCTIIKILNKSLNLKEYFVSVVWAYIIIS